MGRVPLLTRSGYALGEVISALQKDIRRGLEREALYWALQLVPRFEAYLWRRLLVIVHEDIGVADPLSLAVVPINQRAYFQFREAGKDGASRLVLTNTILQMARAPKSRAADHLLCCVQDDIGRDLKPPIPDYALDKHTGRGRSMGRGLSHWFTEGCVLIPPPSAENDKYREEAESRWVRGVPSFDDLEDDPGPDDAPPLPGMEAPKRRRRKS